MPETREQIAARVVADVSWTMDPHGFRIATAHAAAGVSAGVKAVTDRVREMHIRHVDIHADHPINRGWACCGSVQLHLTFPEACAVCRDEVWPCAWIRWADQIDAELGGE